MPERTYTTHDIAKFCDVYPSSVIHWINSGKLQSYSTPGGHHRVTKEDLIAFLREFRIPLPEELSALTRVMVVDDDVELARIIERAFLRHKSVFKTQVCHNGIDALIQIGQQPPDLVVLDIVLPKMDGMQVCRALKSKAETRNIKIIAVTGKKLHFDEKTLAEAKIDAFFRKPLDMLQLVEKSAELLRLKLGSDAKR